MNILDAFAGIVRKCSKKNPANQLPGRYIPLSQVYRRPWKRDLPLKAPCHPRSRTRSECQITVTEVKQVIKYGGAVRAFATNYHKEHALGKDQFGYNGVITHDVEIERLDNSRQISMFIIRLCPTYSNR